MAEVVVKTGRRQTSFGRQKARAAVKSAMSRIGLKKSNVKKTSSRKRTSR